MKRTVLIVDDDEEVCNSLRENIYESGPYNLEVIQTNDLEKAVDLYHLHKGSLTHLVIDYFMPIDNGSSLCEIVKKSHPNVEVILCSGDATLDELAANSPYIDHFVFKGKTFFTDVVRILKK